MKTTVQAVVIGGGVVGASVLYHLTKAGWKDVVLLERDELTSGSTWHAAGGFHTLNGDPNVAKLQRYTIELYAELEKISGQSCGLHLTGGLQLADNAERMDFLRLAHAKGRYLGMETEIISASEAKKLLPLIDESKFVGALWDPAEGHLDPSGTTHAYVKAARIQGADVERFCKVEDLQQRLDGTWTVITNKGNIHAEHVVNAGGLWAREVGRMVGLELPVLAMEHMYLLTEDMPEVAEIMAETGKEVVHAIDFKGEIYTRQEGNGMLMGTYEQACRPWSPQNTPWDFGHELLDPDIDRIAPSLEIGFEHFPAFQNAGIKQIINGPFTFSPDGNPLMGPVRGLRNYWCACAVMAGFSQGGGVGLALSNWMVNGDPGFDVWGMDVARFGNWATMGYTNKKVQENYQRRFRIRFPNEELPACRPIQTTPIYDLQLQAGAVMGDSWGLEVPLWYAEKGEKAEDIVSFRRSNDFEPIKRECKAVRDSVGLTEIANFAKYEITGSGAEAWLSHMMTNTMPRIGRIVLTPMLNDNGKLIGDFTIAKAAEGQFFMFGSSQAQIYHMRWFEEHLPDDGSVIIRNIDLGLVGLSIAGPNARKVLAKLCVDDVSGETFKFMDFRQMDVAAVPALVNRISYTGDLGYEIWVAPEYQRKLYLALLDAGEEFSIRQFGMRALLSLRLEKNFGTWYREFRSIYGVYEADLGRFVKLSKDDFIGKAAAIADKESTTNLRRVAFIVDVNDADVMGDEPIWFEGKVVGWITSGGYAHNFDCSIAQGYLPQELALQTGDKAFEIEILGQMCTATIQEQPLFDPTAVKMRA